VALFKRGNDVEVSISPEFDKEFKPGESPIRPSIYRCSGTRTGFIGTPSGVWGGPDDLPSWLILSLPLMGCLQQPLATRLSQHELEPIT
jgi:hypothetical protein